MFNRVSASLLSFLCLGSLATVACSGDDADTAVLTGAASGTGGEGASSSGEGGDPNFTVGSSQPGSGGDGGAGTGGDGGSSSSGGEGGQSDINPLYSKAYLGTTGEVIANDVATDTAGNFIVVGLFSGTADFGGGALTSAMGGASNDVFVAKYASNGTFIWAKKFGDESNPGHSFNTQAARGVATDGDNNIIVCGTLTNAIRFGPAPAPLLTAGDTLYPDGFLVKLDDDGNHVWSKRYGATASNTDEAYSCAVDGSDNVLVTGRFQSSLQTDNNGTTSTGNALMAAGGAGDYDIFLAKYSPAGAHLFSENFTAEETTEQTPFSVAASKVDGAIALTGYTKGDLDFGNGIHQVASGERGFIVRLNSSFVVQHSAIFAGSGNNRGTGVAFGPTGDLFVTGNFDGSINLGSGAVAGTGSGNDDIFVARFDNNHNIAWVRTYGDQLSQQADSISVGNDNLPVITGRSTGGLEFGSVVIENNGGFDGFVAKLNSKGYGYWALGFGGAGFQEGSGVSVDGSNNTVLTGNFSGALDVGTGNIATNGASDIFVARYGP